MTTVRLEGIRKVYANGFEAVHELDLTINEGEFVVLVGPSGCGKTTVLRMVAGLEEISSGRLIFGDRLMNSLAPRDRDIAMVFQNYALYPHMTVAENIGFALKLRKVPKDETRSKVLEAASILALDSWLERKPSQLSGGQRQRVAMGRAMVREPSVFLMDEPLSNLDAKLRVQMRAEVSRIQRRLGVATLYVTHDQTEAMTMGDRVAVLEGGRLQQCDVPQVLYDHPANAFVAAFIGSPSMNLYEARVNEDGRSLQLGSQRVDLPDEVYQRHPALASFKGRQVIAGVRPEHLHVPRQSEQPFFAGDIDLIEALGSELLVHFSIDAKSVHAGKVKEDPDALAMVSGEGIARIGPKVKVAAGSRVEIGIDPEELQFFDPDGGASIWA